MKLMMGLPYRSKIRRKASSSPRRARAISSSELFIKAPARPLDWPTSLIASIIFNQLVARATKKFQLNRLRTTVSRTDVQFRSALTLTRLAPTTFPTDKLTDYYIRHETFGFLSSL